MVYIGCLNHTWLDEILEDNLSLSLWKICNFGYLVFIILSYGYSLCRLLAHLVYIQHIWITVLYLLVFYPWYLHLYYGNLYPVFMTNTMISVLHVHCVLPVCSSSCMYKVV